MNLTELSQQIHAGNVQRGFYDHPATFPDRCMLIVSEIAEAVEAHRNGKMAVQGAARYLIETKSEIDIRDFSQDFRCLIKDTVQDEIADAIIRLLDLSGYMGIDIDAHVHAKLAYNATRPRLHGKAY